MANQKITVSVTEIVSMRFDKGLNLREIGEEVGVSKQRIEQIIKKPRVTELGSCRNVS